MKILLHTIHCLVVLISFSATGQNLRWGVKAGLNVANLSADNDYYSRSLSTKWKPSFNAGGSLNASIRKNTSIQAEILYSNKGALLRSGASRYNTELHYLTLPILFNYSPIRHFSLEIGPELGYLIRSTSPVISIDSKLDFSLNVGIRYAVHPSVNLGIRYSAGLFPAGKFYGYDDRGFDPNIGVSSFFNRTLQLSVGYIIN